MERITLILAFAAVFLAATALYFARQPSVVPEPVVESHELVYQMGYLQRYSAKAQAAGTAANWPLADFYAHELEEAVEDIITAGYVEDSFKISELAENWLVPSLDSLGDAIDAEDAEAFAVAIEGMIQSCNACHAATGHPYLRMQVAAEHAFPNQSFDPR